MEVEERRPRKLLFVSCMSTDVKDAALYKSWRSPSSWVSDDQTSASKVTMDTNQQSRLPGDSLLPLNNRERALVAKLSAMPSGSSNLMLQYLMDTDTEYARATMHDVMTKAFCLGERRMIMLSEDDYMTVSRLITLFQSHMASGENGDDFSGHPKCLHELRERLIGGREDLARFHRICIETLKGELELEAALGQEAQDDMALLKAKNKVLELELLKAQRDMKRLLKAQKADTGAGKEKRS